MIFLRQLFTIGIGPPKRSHYGGMETSDVKRLKDLEADASRRSDLTIISLKSFSQKRQLKDEIVKEDNIAVSKACKIVKQFSPNIIITAKGTTV